MIRVLDDLVLEAGNLRTSAGHIPRDVLNEYVSWPGKAERVLQGTFHLDDVRALIHTRRHRALRSMHGGTPGLLSAVFLELNERRREFERLVEGLKSLRARWADRAGDVLIPDSNIFIQQPHQIDALDWFEISGSGRNVHVVIPLMVVDELDNLKRSSNKTLRTRA